MIQKFYNYLVEIHNCNRGFIAHIQVVDFANARAAMMTSYIHIIDDLTMKET